VEEEEELCDIGLHAIRRGDILGCRYQAEGLLGRGGFSAVWLCRDQQDGTEVAVKVYKAGERYREFALGELRILQAVTKCKPPALGGAASAAAAGQLDAGSRASSAGVLALLEQFWQDGGPHCRHACLVLELLGPSVLELAQRCRGDQLPASLLRAAARDALRGLDFLHRGCGIIHTDVKPENLLLTVLDGGVAGTGPLSPASRHAKRRRGPPPGCARRRRMTCERALAGGEASASGCPRASFALADLGNSCFADAKVSDYIQTCEYKAPEVLLGAGYGCSADLWSLACTLFECATGRYLLDPRRVQARPQELAAAEAAAADAAATRDARPAAGVSGAGVARGSPEVPIEEEHIAQIAELTGPLPDRLLRRGLLTGELLVEQPAGWTLRRIGRALPQLRRCGLRQRLSALLREERAVGALEGLLAPMLPPEPSLRSDAKTILEGCCWLWEGAAPRAARRSRWDP